MKRLFLLRHAKSSWDDPGEDDHDRPLNARGRAAAPEIGRHMRRAGYIPSLILCSSARRTVETYELIAPHLGPDVPATFDESLYLAEWPALLDTVKRAPDPAKSVLVLGHNPGLEQLAAALSEDESEAEAAMSRRMGEKFPTGALAVLDFDVTRWRSVKLRSGRLTDFVRPRDL